MQQLSVSIIYMLVANSSHSCFSLPKILETKVEEVCAGAGILVVTN